MARALKAKKLAHFAVKREGRIYRLQVEDEAGKKVLFEVTSDQALRLADTLDHLLADEEEEQIFSRDMLAFETASLTETGCRGSDHVRQVPNNIG